MPFSIGWRITLTGSRSRARASAKQPPSITSLTPSLPTDLMTTSIRERALAGGRDHRNPRPASIGTGGRLRSESPADFVGMRTKRGSQLNNATTQRCSGYRSNHSSPQSVSPAWLTAVFINSRCSLAFARGHVQGLPDERLASSGPIGRND